MSQLSNCQTLHSSDVIRWTENSSYLDICMDRNTADQALALLQLKSVVHSSIFCEGRLGWAGVNDDGEGGTNYDEM